MKKFILGIFIIESLAASIVGSSVIKQTPTDIEQAVVDIPEKIKIIPQVQTLVGEQSTPGTLESERNINQEIYNDLATFQLSMQSLMDSLLQIDKTPLAKLDFEKKAGQIIQLIQVLGFRYGYTKEFQIHIESLQKILNEALQTASFTRGYAPVSNFMLYKSLLETILAEIQNSLYLKLQD